MFQPDDARGGGDLLRYAPIAPGAAPNEFITRRAETRDWLVDFNAATPRAIESLYPDLGHGPVPDAAHDKTVVVRQHYPAAPLQDAQPVTLLTVVDGGHSVPGANGNHAPCGFASCDIVAVDEIRQFWRAYAGLDDTP